MKCRTSKPVRKIARLRKTGIFFICWLLAAASSFAAETFTVADAANAGDWSFQNNLQAGAQQYGDRAFTFASVPPEVAGLAWLRTANDSKAYTGSPLVTIQLGQAMDVYVAHNDAITAKPSWLSGWTDTGLNIVNNEAAPRTFSLYVKSFASGAAVTLGANGSTGEGMYAVILAPAGELTVTAHDTANAGDWSFQDNLQSGNQQYGDRTFAFTSVPAQVAGQTWLRTANDSKAYTGNPLATVQLVGAADLYMAHNDAIGTKPAWLNGWADSGLNLVNNEPVPKTFSLYVKSFAPGSTVELGMNGSTTEGMYTVILKTASVSPFGISQNASISSYAAWMPAIAGAGVRGFRYFPEWSGIEPANNSYNFSGADAYVAASLSNNMQVSGVLAYSPTWTASSHHEFPLSNLADWADYVGNAVGRYDGNPQPAVAYWEVWNEPNAGSFNTGNRPASDYATLVKTAYTAAKAANPDARIGITVANYDVRYLKQVIESLSAQGAAGSFDFIAVHPYELVARMNAPDGEMQYLNIVPAIRQMLAVHAPAKAGVPIRFTELGARIGDNLEGETCTAQIAAKLLVKAYVLGIVQGAEEIDWFEAKEPTSDPSSGAYGFGLLDAAQNKRTSWYAYKAMTDSMGIFPFYKGWLALGPSSSGYGLVFGGAGSDVMAAWMPKGETATITFGGTVQIIDIYSNTSSSGTSVALTDKPVFIRNLPAALVSQASANQGQPYPWASDPVNASLSRIQLGAALLSSGLDLDRAQTVVANGAGTQGIIVNQAGSAAYFSLNPAFASFATHDVYVRVTARQTAVRTGNTYCGMNLFYQPISGNATAAPQYPYANKGQWFGLANHTNPQTFTWHLTDAIFVNTFGHGFYFQFDASVPFVIDQVEVSKVAF